MKTAVTLMSNDMLDLCREYDAHGLFDIVSAVPLPPLFRDNAVVISSGSLPINGWNGEVVYEIRKDDVGVYHIKWLMLNQGAWL
jgi:hypothetical protein